MTTDQTLDMLWGCLTAEHLLVQRLEAELAQARANCEKLGADIQVECRRARYEQTVLPELRTAGVRS